MPIITFLLPAMPVHPAGGYKVVYEYANRLANDGFSIRIAYAGTVFFKQRTFIGKIKSIIKYAYFKATRNKHFAHWMNLNSNIEEYLVPSLDFKHMKPSDYYVATAVQTAEYLNAFPVPNKCKLYLIQDFEDWFVTKEAVYKTYSYGMKNIVISNWLKNIVEKSGNNCTLIPNGFDFNFFKQTIDIKDKEQYTISMLYHNDFRKGCKYGIEALIKLKEKYPQLNAILFGVPSRPKNLPSWIEYYQQPDKDTHNLIYNRSSIFLAPSLTEGWGLTVGEAMICGCTIVCTDADGFLEMIKDNINGLVCKKEDSDDLVSKIEALFIDDKLRISLAEKSSTSIRKFSWDKSYPILKGLITEISSDTSATAEIASSNTKKSK